MIYTVTLNPAIDYIMDAENIEFGATNRSQNEVVLFGGKGINVSVILSRLGYETTALGFAAGFTGEHLKNSLENEGVRVNFTNLDSGITRINLKLRGGGSITEINAQGPEITKKDLDNLYSELSNINSGDTLVLAGSIPKGLGSDIYCEIISRLEQKNVKIVVDATGDALLETLKFKPFLIKPNRDELEQIFGTVQSEEQIIESAKKLKSMGAQNVLVSLGSEGAILLDENGKIYKSPTHKITPKNTVGAGDSMVAGFIAGVDKGYEYALLLGIAAGAATASNDSLSSKSEILNLMNERVDIIENS